MKREVFVIVLIVLFGLNANVFCQSVDNIKVEQAGDFIKVRYQILNSNPNQVFRVTVLCSINGGLQSVLKSLSGDFGENVVGGRDEYMVLWDVLKDVDEVKSVDFSIRAELKKDNSLPVKSRLKMFSSRKIHVLSIAGGPGPNFGFRIGYMGSWGLTTMFLRRDKRECDFSDETGTIRTGDTQIWIKSLDVTKRIVNKKVFALHLFAGVAFSKFVVQEDILTTPRKNDFVNCLGIDMGVIFSIKRFVFSYSITAFNEDRDNNMKIVGDRKFDSIGLGYRF